MPMACGHPGLELAGARKSLIFIQILKGGDARPLAEACECLTRVTLNAADELGQQVGHLPGPVKPGGRNAHPAPPSAQAEGCFRDQEDTASPRSPIRRLTYQMGKNNFGWGSRQAEKAIGFALKDAAARGEISFATAATITERFATSWQELRDDGARWLEDVTKEMVVVYGQELAERVENGEISPAYAQNLVSAINTAMTVASRGEWQSVSSVKDCQIPERSSIRSEAPAALDRGIYQSAVQQVREALGDRAAAVVELAREFGLRSKEASLLDARTALAEARERGQINVTLGTKGGRDRSVPITSQGQLAVLSRAAEAQGADRSMIPAYLSWKEWREGPLRGAREIVQEVTGGSLHDMRAAYACERYQALTGHASPVAGGEIADREADRAAREQIAEELGHGRIDVVSAYVGGR